MIKASFRRCKSFYYNLLNISRAQRIDETEDLLLNGSIVKIGAVIMGVVPPEADGEFAGNRCLSMCHAGGGKCE